MSVADQPAVAMPAASCSNTVCYLLLHIPVPSETFIINEIISLQDAGMKVFPVSMRSPQDCHPELMSSLQNPVHYLGDVARERTTHLLYPTAHKLAASFGIAAELALQAAVVAGHLFDIDADLIHAHFATEAAMVAMLASELTGKPFTFTAHAYDIYRLNVMGERYPDQRLRLLMEKACKIVTVSEINKSHLLEVSGQVHADKVAVVRCSVAVPRFRRAQREQPGKITFLSVGRLVEKKGHEFLLRSFATVLKTCDVCLRIVGEGALRPGLMALARELGVADKVTFLGAISSSMVFHELHHADIFVLHSLTGSDGDREGIPVAIMEACAVGLPVVVTRHSGIPELVTDGLNGFVVAEKDCDGFAEAMCTLALLPELRQEMGGAGRAIVAEKFNPQRETQKLKDIFAAIIAAQRTAQVGITQRHQVVDGGLLRDIRCRFAETIGRKLC